MPGKLITNLYRSLGALAITPEVEFPAGEPVSIPYDLTVGIIGTILRVPHDCAAVLMVPYQDELTFGPGDHLIRLPAGGYTLYFVQISEQHMDLGPEPFTCGWGTTTLAVTLHWQVFQPQLMIMQGSPQQLLAEVFNESLASIKEQLSRWKTPPGEDELEEQRRCLADSLQDTLSWKLEIHGIRINQIQLTLEIVPHPSSQPA